MSYHEGIFCPTCDERYEVSRPHLNGYTYYTCPLGHEWFRSSVTENRCTKCNRVKPRRDSSPCYQCVLEVVAAAQDAARKARERMHMLPPIVCTPANPLQEYVINKDYVNSSVPEKLMVIDDVQEIDKADIEKMKRLFDPLPPPDIQDAINQHIDPEKPSTVLIRDEPQLYEYQKLAIAKLTGVGVAKTANHPRTRTIYLMAPKGAGKMKAFIDGIDHLDSLVNPFRRHMSDITIDGDMIPLETT